MSRSHRRAAHPRPAPPRVAGALLVGTATLVAAALVGAPWLARRVTVWRPAPAVAAFVALVPALYAWFHLVQQARPRTATILAVVYATLAAAALWWWQGG